MILKMKLWRDDMAKNRPINSDFWIDEYIESISINGRYLFLYLLTNPDCHISGVYKTTLKRIASDTELKKEEVEKLLKDFSDNDKVYFNSGYIIIVNFLNYQKPNINMFKSIKKQIENLPTSALNFLIEVDTKLFSIVDKCVEELIKSIAKDLKEFESLYKGIGKALKGFRNPFKAFERLLISKSKSKSKDQNKNQDEDEDEKPLPPKPKPTPKQIMIDFFNSIAPDWINKDLFIEFIKNRYEMKKPLTERAVKANIKKLKGFMDKGHDQIKVINNAVAGGWQSFYEPKTKPKQSEIPIHFKEEDYDVDPELLAISKKNLELEGKNESIVS